jgi:hypothetical protein
MLYNLERNLCEVEDAHVYWYSVISRFYCTTTTTTTTTTTLSPLKMMMMMMITAIHFQTESRAL